MEASAARQEGTETLTAAEFGMRIRLMWTVCRTQQQELAIAASIAVAHLCKDRSGLALPAPDDNQGVGRGPGDRPGRADQAVGALPMVWC